MEREIGAPLFTRNTHDVVLTDEGKFFVRWAELLIERSSRAVSALHKENGKHTGKVHVLCEEQR